MDRKEMMEIFDSLLEEHETGFEYVEGRRDGILTFMVDAIYVGDFCGALSEYNVDMVGFPCYVGGSGIWFTEDDLKEASFY